MKKLPKKLKARRKKQRRLARMMAAHPKSLEQSIAELAPEATFRAFTESVKKGGATIMRGNNIVRVTPVGTEVLETIESPYSSRQFAPGTRLKLR